jgi:hypothetical protein
MSSTEKGQAYRARLLARAAAGDQAKREAEAWVAGVKERVSAYAAQRDAEVAGLREQLAALLSGSHTGTCEGCGRPLECRACSEPA